MLKPMNTTVNWNKEETNLKEHLNLRKPIVIGHVNYPTLIAVGDVSDITWIGHLAIENET